jgi:hypothetical protein
MPVGIRSDLRKPAHEYRAGRLGGALAERLTDGGHNLMLGGGASAQERESSIEPVAQQLSLLGVDNSVELGLSV